MHTPSVLLLTYQTLYKLQGRTWVSKKKSRNVKLEAFASVSGIATWHFDVSLQPFASAKPPQSPFQRRTKGCGNGASCLSAHHRLRDDGGCTGKDGHFTKRYSNRCKDRRMKASEGRKVDVGPYPHPNKTALSSEGSHHHCCAPSRGAAPRAQCTSHFVQTPSVAPLPPTPLFIRPVVEEGAGASHRHSKGLLWLLTADVGPKLCRVLCCRYHFPAQMVHLCGQVSEN